MTLKILKPYTKSTRGTVLLSRDVWRGKPHKSLTRGKNLRVEETILGELLQDTKVLVIKKNIDL